MSSTPVPAAEGSADRVLVYPAPVRPGTRFDALDGLRGLAAIAVMVFHYTEHNGLRWIGNSWVAVDLFFVLSGFVIAHSYADKIAGGMHFSRFLSLRWMRLGPLYVIGLALGVVALVVTLRLDPPATPVPTLQWIWAIILGLFWLPFVNDMTWPFAGDVIRGAIFPLNIPAWSLFFELTVNVVFFACVRATGRTAGRIWILLAWAGFVVLTWRWHVLNPGWSSNWHGLVLGMLRVTAEFFLGALIWQQGWHRSWLAMRMSSAAIAVGAVCLLAFAMTSPKAALLNTLVGVPLTITLLAGVDVRGWAQRASRLLGEISYPLYILHYPLFQLCFELTSLRDLRPELQVVLVGLLSLALAALVAKLDRAARARWSSRAPRPA
jgi:peptidoglycan/LPS O-acetylase OafA/YrhL